jgi:hypothetical protein
VLKIHPNARKQGAPDAVIAASFINAFETVFEADDNGSIRWLALGPDGAGNPLETV